MFGEPLLLGLATLARVVVLVALATVVWVPVGVKIGFSPRLTRIAQPIVQILASFPANFLFPLAVWFFLRTGLSINIGGTLLMALGAQWYILFNTIACCHGHPERSARGHGRPGRHRPAALAATDRPGDLPVLRHRRDHRVRRRLERLDRLRGRHLRRHHSTATGLGAYIAKATESGDYPHLLAGVAVMSLYVVGLNRLVWRRLYRLAETRYSL
ncbi:hypothetical protein ACQ4WX_46985 [Streptomyces lasalocidi]